MFTRKFTWVITIILCIGLFAYFVYPGKTVCKTEFRNLRLEVKSLLNPPILEPRDKVWLHRCDSAEKFSELGSRYTGVEIDVIFHQDAQKFESSHDTVSLEKYPLEKILDAYKKQGLQQFIWLDFKNLSKDNQLDSLKELERLVTLYGIQPTKIWVESTHYEYLKSFKNAGFKTRYYFPYYDFERMKPHEIEQVKDKTLDIAQSGNVDAISFFGDYLDFIKRAAPLQHIRLLMWFDGTDRKDFEQSTFGKNILADPSVEAVLVREKGKYHR